MAEDKQDRLLRFKMWVKSFGLKFNLWAEIFGSVAVVALVLVAFFNWNSSRWWQIISWAFIGFILLFLLGVALDSQVKPDEKGYSHEGENRPPDELASIHQRANHEDILHTSRLGIFLTFNAFLGVAIGVSKPFPAIVFAILGFLIGWFWIRWAGNAMVTIRVLRDAGKWRADEKLWRKYVGILDKKIGAINIFNKIIPTLLCLTWLTIGLYYTYSLAFDP